MTIKEIAKMANVSPSTVSRYLNSGYVDEKKKEIIQKVIEKTGYTPSISAKMLRTKKTNVIGIIVPKISSEAVSRMVDGIASSLNLAGYNILFGVTELIEKKEIEYLNIFSQNNVDGIIFIATALNDKHYIALKKADIPVVIVGQKDDKYSCIYHNDYQASFELTKHLGLQGCKKIGYIGVSKRDKSAGYERFLGYSSALKELGLEIDERLILEGEFSSKSGYELVQTLIDNKYKFDGLFCATDSIAAGAIKCLDNNKISCPGMVKTVSIGDTKIAEYFRPTLTSAHYYYKTCGMEAGKLICEMIDSHTNIKQNIMLGFEIKVRESSTKE